MAPEDPTKPLDLTSSESLYLVSPRFQFVSEFCYLLNKLFSLNLSGKFGFIEEEIQNEQGGNRELYQAYFGAVAKEFPRIPDNLDTGPFEQLLWNALQMRAEKFARPSFASLIDLFGQNNSLLSREFDMFNQMDPPANGDYNSTFSEYFSSSESFPFIRISHGMELWQISILGKIRAFRMFEIGSLALAAQTILNPSENSGNVKAVNAGLSQVINGGINN